MDMRENWLRLVDYYCRDFELVVLATKAEKKPRTSIADSKFSLTFNPFYTDCSYLLRNK